MHNVRAILRVLSARNKAAVCSRTVPPFFARRDCDAGTPGLPDHSLVPASGEAQHLWHCLLGTRSLSNSELPRRCAGGYLAGLDTHTGLWLCTHVLSAVVKSGTLVGRTMPPLRGRCD